MSNKKMIHVFNEMVVKAGRDVDTAELHFINGGVSATFFCAQQAHHAAHAINNHDRLVEENKQQRESLDAFRELVKAQTQTMNELNEKCKEFSEGNTELREALQSALNIKNLWLPETNMIVHADEFCALHKMHDSFKKLL